MWKGVFKMTYLPTLRLGSQSSYVKRLKMDLNGLGKNYNNFVIIYNPKDILHLHA